MLSCSHWLTTLVVPKMWFIFWYTIRCVMFPLSLSTHSPYIIVHEALTIYTINSNNFYKLIGGNQMNLNQQIFDSISSYLDHFKDYNAGFTTVYHICMWENSSRRWINASILSVFDKINSLLLSSPSLSSLYFLFYRHFIGFGTYKLGENRIYNGISHMYVQQEQYTL